AAVDCTEGGAVARCESNAQGGAAESAFCKQLERVPGGVRCSRTSVTQCNPGGAGDTQLLDCRHGCDPATLACKEPACEPGTYRCSDDQQFVEICNTLGTGFARQNCALAGSGSGRCVPTPEGPGPDAQCVTTVCNPGSRRCDG